MWSIEGSSGWIVTFGAKNRAILQRVLVTVPWTARLPCGVQAAATPATPSITPVTANFWLVVICPAWYLRMWSFMKSRMVKSAAASARFSCSTKLSGVMMQRKPLSVSGNNCQGHWTPGASLYWSAVDFLLSNEEFLIEMRISSILINVFLSRVMARKYTHEMFLIRITHGYNVNRHGSLQLCGAYLHGRQERAEALVDSWWGLKPQWIRFDTGLDLHCRSRCRFVTVLSNEYGYST